MRSSLYLELTEKELSDIMTAALHTNLKLAEGYIREELNTFADMLGAIM